MPVCAQDGCPERVRRGYCATHAKPRKRSPSSVVTSTARWRRVKTRVLKRDGYVCRYCGERADTVDHVRPVSKGGHPFDEANLAASCTPCNSRKRARPWPCPMP